MIDKRIAFAPVDFSHTMCGTPPQGKLMPSGESSAGYSLDTISDFLVTKRVTISIVLLGLLIVEDVVFVTKPQHGWLADADWKGRLAVVLVVLGVAVRSWAAGTLHKGIDLSTKGPYSVCRHPLYLGSLLVMLGFCATIGYLHDYLVVCGPICGIYWLTIRREERRLTEKYGARWSDYAAITPRLIPWQPFNFAAIRWSGRQWLKNREYQAFAGCSLGLIALELWRLFG